MTHWRTPHKPKERLVAEWVRDVLAAVGAVAFVVGVLVFLWAVF